MLQPCLLLSLAVLGDAAAHMPKFSWDTLPVFYHSANVTGLYNNDSLRILAKYPLLTFEKYQGPLAWSDEFAKGTIHEEDNIAAMAEAIKGVNPQAAVLMYMHQWNYPWYSYHWDLEGRPEWWAKDPSTGSPQMMDVPNVNCTSSTNDTSKPPRCPMAPVHVRDWNNTEAVHGWANACARMVNAGLDGCFVDGVCDPKCGFASGIDQGLELMQRKVGEGTIIGNGAYRGEYFPSAKGSMIENFGVTGKLGKFWVETLRDAAQKGMLMEVHTHTCPPLEIDVAGFLVAAEENSFFGCGSWYEVAGGPIWPEVFDKPLGAPLGHASVVDDVWTRSFSSGTKVTLDLNHKTASIQWADGLTHDALV